MMWAEDSRSKTRKQPPKEWVFKGYVAFVLFGCPGYTPIENRLLVFTEGSTHEGKSASRAVERKKIKDERAKKRSIESTQSFLPGVRGVNMEDTLLKRHIACKEADTLQQEITNDTKQVYANIFTLEKRIQSIVSQRTDAMKLIQMYKDNGMEDEDEYKQGLSEIKWLSTELRTLNEEMKTARGNLQPQLQQNASKKIRMVKENAINTTPVTKSDDSEALLPVALLSSYTPVNVQSEQPPVNSVTTTTTNVTPSTISNDNTMTTSTLRNI